MNKTVSEECEVTGKMPTENGPEVCNDTTAEKIVGIYGLRNKVNNKWYVGQSVDVYDRWNSYRKLKCRSQRKLFHALSKYGFDTFEKTLIEPCENVQWILDYREMYWIRILDSINNGYNIREGGQGGKHSEETKRRMSLAATGKKKPPFSAEWKNNMRKALLGRKHSEETKEKIRQAHLGMKTSAETKQKLRTINLGKSMSDFVKQKIRQKVKGRKLPPRSEEWCNKISKAKTGKKLSLEHRQKISNGLHQHSFLNSLA